MVSRDYLLLTGKLEVWKSKAKIENSLHVFYLLFKGQDKTASYSSDQFANSSWILLLYELLKRTVYSIDQV